LTKTKEEKYFLNQRLKNFFKMIKTKSYIFIGMKYLLRKLLLSDLRYTFLCYPWNKFYEKM